MSIYICRDCGETFDEPKHYTERHGLETGPYEGLTCCPFCGGSYEEAVTCEGCGRLIPESEACVTDDLQHMLCTDCTDALVDQPTPADMLHTSIEAVYADHQVDNEGALRQDAYTVHTDRPTLDSAWRLDESPLGDLILDTLRHCDPDSEQSWCLTGYDPTAKLLTERALDHLVIDSVLDTHVIPGHWRPLVARAIAVFANTQLYDQPKHAAQLLDAAVQLDPYVLMAYPTTVCDLHGVVTAMPGESEAVLEELADETLHALRHDLHWAEAQHMPILVQVGPHVYLLPGDALTCEEVSDVCWSSTKCKSPEEAHD